MSKRDTYVIVTVKTEKIDYVKDDETDKILNEAL